MMTCLFFFAVLAASQNQIPEELANLKEHPFIETIEKFIDEKGTSAVCEVKQLTSKQGYHSFNELLIVLVKTDLPELSCGLRVAKSVIVDAEESRHQCELQVPKKHLLTKRDLSPKMKVFLKVIYSLILMFAIGSEVATVYYNVADKDAFKTAYGIVMITVMNWFVFTFVKNIGSMCDDIREIRRGQVEEQTNQEEV